MPDVERLNKTLDFLDVLYNQHLTADDPDEAVAFAKLAVIEFCGWIETTIDDIARAAVEISLPQVRDRRYLEEKIRLTWGFDYKRNVMPLLVHALGTIKYSQIEQTLKDEELFERFAEVLNNDDFRRMRNQAAHTFLDGTPRSFDAPSRVKGKLLEIAPLLDRMHYLCQER